MILPISHERSTARRWPVVATAIFLVCFVVECVLTETTRGAEARVQGAERSVASYDVAHPYLKLPNAGGDLDARAIAFLRDGAHAEQPEADTIAQEQAQLDALLAEIDRARRVGSAKDVW